MCRHSKLVEVDNLTGMEVNITGQKGNIIGMFQWKKYICEDCDNLITILSAVVEQKSGRENGESSTTA